MATLFDENRFETEIDAKVKTIVKNELPKESVHRATVLRQDSSGIWWVRLDSGEETPVLVNKVDMSVGDVVTVTLRDHVTYADGNITSPPMSASNTEQYVGDVVAHSVKAVTADIGFLKADVATIGYAQIEDADITNARIQNLVYEVTQNITHLNAVDASILELQTNSLTANSAVITNLQSETAKIQNLEAEQLEATVGYIEGLTAENIDASDIVADHAEVASLDANYAHITHVDANTAIIDNAKIGYADVAGLAANYAQIDFQNVISQQAAYAVVQNLLTTSGWFETTQVGQETVHYLTAVHIDANDVDIEHLKVRDLYLFDDTQGTEGVWYQLNVTAGGITYSDLTPAMQAEVKAGLHGDNIIAATVTADKIYVQDLSAFNATIAGMVFDTVTIGGADYYSMHTFGKTTVNSNTPGMYTDSMGQFSVGTASDYLMFYKDGNGAWKLAISAELITMGGSTLASQIQTLQSQIDNVVETWFGEGVPTLSNYPASSWTTGAIKNVHLGDVYYDNDTGRAYRFALSSTSTPNNPVYEWVQIPDSAVAAVMESVNGLSGDVSTLATMAANTLIYDHTYEFVQSDGTVQGETAGEDVAVFTAHLYRGGEDIAASMTASEQQQFTWYLRNEGEVTGTLIGQGLTLRVRLAEMGYGSHIVGRYTTVEEAALLTEEDDNLTTSDDDDLIARTPSGGSVRVSDLSVVTVVNGTDKILVVGAEDEHLVTVDTLKGVFGTPSYTNITDKPSIEGVTLIGNKSFPDLGIFMTDSQGYPVADDYTLTTMDINALWANAQPVG